MRASAKWVSVTAIAFAGMALLSMRWKSAGPDGSARAAAPEKQLEEMPAGSSPAALSAGETIRPELKPTPKPKLVQVVGAAPLVNTPDLAARWLVAAENSGFVKIRIAQTTQLTLESFADFFAQAGLTA